MNPDPAVPPDDLGELMCALLDGELAPDEQERVERFVAGSPAAQTELAALSAVRSLVRDLPAVDPPFGFYERLLRPDRSTRHQRHTGARVGAALAVAAAAVVLIIGVTPAADSVVPPVEAFAQRHVQMDPATAGSGTEPSPDQGPTDFTPMAADQLDEMGAPAELAGQFRRVSGYRSGGTRTLHLMYTDGTVMVSVYEQTGLVSWESLPGGTMVQVDGAPAWTSERDREAVMVVERGPIVYTVIAQMSPDSHDEMVALADGLPAAADPSLVDRAANGCRSVAAQFSLGMSDS